MKAVNKKDIINIIKIVSNIDTDMINININGYSAVVTDKKNNKQYKCVVGDYIILNNNVEVVSSELFNNKYMLLDSVKYSDLELDTFLVKAYSLVNNREYLKGIVLEGVEKRYDNIKDFGEVTGLRHIYYALKQDRDVKLKEDTIYSILEAVKYPDAYVISKEIREDIREYLYRLQGNIKSKDLAKYVNIEYQRFMKDLRDLDINTMFSCINYLKNAKNKKYA